ncbi:MAG: MerR family DNA-binding protein, partial [Gemmatimonadota bacterium]|nr:MerR family DNA-binding protein [Gemmatimonadota bacterium]
LPDGRTPNKADWASLSRSWRDQLAERIEVLEKLKENLTGCIGCGCLSLRLCSLFNEGDEIASRVDGSLLMGRPEARHPSSR